MSTVPVLIEYASQSSTGMLDVRCVRAAKPMLLTSIFSGLCVAACFLSMMRHDLATLLHFAVFATTIFFAVRSGQALGVGEAGLPKYVVLDFLALIGLLGIAVAPSFYGKLDNVDSPQAQLIGALGGCYLLLAITTVRHIFSHRQISDWLRQYQRYGLARSFYVLGWFKLVYESLWLGCCAITLLLLAADNRFSGPAGDMVIFFAFGSLFGAMGFGLIWIWMIIVHAMLLHVASKFQRPV